MPLPGPPPHGMCGLMCCRNRMTSVPSRSSSVSRWQNSIRAWDSSEPQRTIRLLGEVLEGGLELPAIGPVHPGYCRWRA
jgi:hypothetical protein